MHGLQDFVVSATMWQASHQRMQEILVRLQQISRLYNSRSLIRSPAMSSHGQGVQTTKKYTDFQADPREHIQDSPLSQPGSKEYAKLAARLSASPASQPGSINSATDYVYNNNYDRLFDAVAMAGVQHSSDSIEDLFSQTSFEPYRTFDDGPLNMGMSQHEAGHLGQWHNQPDMWYDPT